jgi:cytochrome c oxidase subunit 4
MSHEHAEDIKQATRKYIYVFLALLLGTVITVIAAYIPFGSHALNIAVALFIASCKAFLVAGYFMHLISEKRMIYGLMAATGFFFLGLVLLIVFADADQLSSPA